MVEVARYFANRPDLLEVFERVRQRCGTGTSEPAMTVRSTRLSTYDPRAHLLSERLTDDDVIKIVACGREGVPMIKLAEQFKISRSSVKRLLKENGVSVGRGKYQRQ
jgi:hypothetical protein